jgi:hypothetical protein
LGRGNDLEISSLQAEKRLAYGIAIIIVSENKIIWHNMEKPRIGGDIEPFGVS